MKTVSQNAQRHLLLHFENQRCHHLSSRLEPEWSGVYCLEGVPGKGGGGGGRWGQKTPPNAPPSLLTKLIPPVQIRATPPPRPMLGKVSHGKVAAKPNQTL